MIDRANKLIHRDNFIYFFAACASMLLTYWVSIREIVINPDAICYLYSAEAVSKSGLYAAMHLCPQAMWPFYSAVLSAVHAVTPFSYENAAFFLDGIFSLFTVILFIAIVEELGGTRRVMWLAAAVILLSHQFNNVRQYIIRDHGFWAFYLASVFFMLRYFNHATLKNALLWCASMIVATLFRVEGAMFLLALPFLSLLRFDCSWSKRGRMFLSLNFPIVFVLVALGAWLAFHPAQTIDNLGRLAEIKSQLQNGLARIFDKYQHLTTAVNQYLLTEASARDAKKVVVVTGLVWYVFEVLSNLSWIYAALLIFAWSSHAGRFTRTALIVLLGYVLVNVVVTFGFFAENLFLAKRYLIALSLTLMLWVPFAIEKLVQMRNYLLTVVVAALIFTTALGGIFHFGPEKTQIRSAGDWLASNVPANQTLYVNNYQLMYYSHHFGTTIFEKIKTYKDVNMIAGGKWKKFDYLALHMRGAKDDKVARVIQELQIRPLKVFVNKSGDRIYIYKIK